LQVIENTQDIAQAREEIRSPETVKGLAASTESALATSGGVVLPPINEYIAGGLFDLRDVITKPPTPVPWAIDGLVVENGIGLVSGEGGVGKSYILMELALALACGRPLFQNFPVTRPYKVLYVDQEMPEFASRARLGRMMRGVGLTEATVPIERLLVGYNGRLRLDNSGWTSGLRDFVSAYGIEFVLVDSLARTLQGPENDATTANNFFRAVSPMLQANGCGLVLLSHLRKRQLDESMNDPGQRLRGHSAWRDIIDFHMGVDASKCPKDTLDIVPEKSRHGDEVQATFRIKFEHDNREDADGPFRLRVVNTAIDNENQQLVWDAIPPASAGGIRPTELLAAVAPLSYATVKRHISLLMARGMVGNTASQKRPIYARIDSNGSMAHNGSPNQ